MMKFKPSFILYLVVALLAGLLSSLSFAEGFYLFGSLGTANQENSDNTGELRSAFITGTVTGIPLSLNIPAGESVGWQTSLKSDISFSGALGYDYGNIRFELALTRNANNVKSHSGANVSGTDLASIDVGVLLSGRQGDLGISTDAFLRNGTGEIETTSLMLNGYYDFNLNGGITPFIGVGIGNASTQATFAPSNTSVLDDDDSGFAWQAIIGAQYSITDQLSLGVSYRHISIEDVSVNVDLIPAQLNIRNRSQIFEVGLRHSF
ncbi:MAG: outer membrane beta-barrel protein [Gammaproteobacteria bacterium]|nr:outer membrane beta-barrel protein [Gammaproteobacteria bacterium]MCY4357474.1 outer membrane beta-barrel protein [Gammaproteobacteria bacterium]